MKLTYIVLIIAFLAVQVKIQAQGCVAIKGTAGVCGRPSDAKGWELNLNQRYFKSYKHFVGTEEQKQRVEEGSNVINHSYELDVTATGTLNSRWSVAVTLPILAFGRSSLYEHDGKSRHSTHSFGIGDARFSAYRWMFDPKRSHKGNIQLGLGIKLPTGNYNYQDYFYKKADSSVLGPVDQSIEPGDGGTGITFEFNGFYNFSHVIGVYGNFFYLSNPREVNGTSTKRGGTPTASDKKYNIDVMSVPDLMMTRAGVAVMLYQFTFAGGMRVEALPSSDLIGGSRGFRRPGYIVSVEPSVTYVAKKISFNLAVPFAVKRNRTQSDSDKRRSADTGTHVQGDAAFADYLISAGVTIKL
ncbi:MAG: hypothetical protein E6H09_23140 [Bacteroidetes bacterium]|jgi:hypothetical protein|nr:MAG: hypothetical protein E6H09_23140 [Bacteroidota bacterium]